MEDCYEIPLACEVILSVQGITCDECGEMVRNLVDHKRSRHTPDNEKKFRCSVCDKGFTCRQKLNEHELIHGDLRPFPCHYNCGYACKIVGNLRKHEIRCAKRPF